MLDHITLQDKDSERDG